MKLASVFNKYLLGLHLYWRNIFSAKNLENDISSAGFKPLKTAFII